MPCEALCSECWFERMIQTPFACDSSFLSRKVPDQQQIFCWEAADVGAEKETQWEC